MNFAHKGKPPAAPSGRFFGGTAAFKTSSPVIANGSGMGTETGVQSGPVARGFSTDPNDLRAFSSFLSSIPIVDYTETHVRSLQKRGRSFQTWNRLKFRSTAFGWYKPKTCDGTSPGCATARDTTSPRHTLKFKLTHCGHVWMDIF